MSSNSLTFQQLREMSNRQKEQGKNPKFITIKKKMNISHNRKGSFSDKMSINLQSPKFKSSLKMMSPQISPKISKKAIEQLIGKQQSEQQSQKSVTNPKDIKSANQIDKIDPNDYNQNYVKTETNENGDNVSRTSKISNQLLQFQQQYQKQQQQQKLKNSSQQQRRESKNLERYGSQKQLSQSHQFMSMQNSQIHRQNSDMNSSQPDCQQQKSQNDVEPIKCDQNRNSLGSKNSSRMFMSPRNVGGFDSQMYKTTSQFSFSQNQKFESLLQKNQQYLKHLQGDCLCGKCLCGKCKCPKMIFNFETEKGQQTSYQSEFSQKHDNQRLPVIPMDFYDESKQVGNMEFRTTNKGDFIPHDVSEKQNFRKSQQYERKPMFGGSSYKQNFINWGNYSKIQVPKKPNQTVVPDLNFVGKTIYKDNFNKGNNVKKDHDLEFIKNWNKRPNYKNPDFPFQGVTTNSQAFKQYKNSVQQKTRAPQDDFKPMPAYQGQFQSSQQISSKQSQVIECPSRKLLSQLYRQQVQENEKDALKYQSDLKRGQK